MSEQPKSVSDLETDIAKSRERLAATIDELAFRAQPKNIVAEQKRQIRATVMDRYHAIMGNSSRGGSQPTTVGDERTRTIATYGDEPSKADQAKAKAEELKATAMGKAEELKATATAKVDELRSRGESHGQHAAETSGQSGLGDLKTRAQVQADRARLKFDEATHDADGELRVERVATGLAAVGATLIALGVAKRNS